MEIKNSLKGQMTNAYRYFAVKLQCTPACTMLMHLLNEWKDVTNITKAHFIATMVGGKASFFLNIRVTFSLLIAGPLIASSQFAKQHFSILFLQLLLG